MRNVEIRKLEDDIIEILNNSPVEIETKRLIIKDILSIVSKEADRVILAEISEEENAESI